MIRVNNIKISIDATGERMVKKCATLLGVRPEEIKKFTIAKKAVDARNKNDICFVYSLDVEIEDEGRFLDNKNVSAIKESAYYVAKSAPKAKRPVIIGAGPGGLFAALVLSEARLRPIIIERGKAVEERRADVLKFWETGRLDTTSNVQFGEGGAGAFSDGKLTTGIKDFRIGKVIDEFAACGAPEEIKYSAKPHIGTDKLFNVLINLRKKITDLGGEYRFATELIDFAEEKGRLISVKVRDLAQERVYDIECDSCILAIGHSARDTFEMLYEKGLKLQAKPFSVGVRIEHKQATINKAQYGKFWNHKALGAADYKLNCNINGRGVYTFCMCPGGEVVAAASESGRLAVNGMSYFARVAENANSALLVGVNPEDFPGDHPLRGIEFQRELEEKAFKLGGGNFNAPVQLVGDFLRDRPSRELRSVVPSYKPGYKLCDLRKCLPDFIGSAIKGALPEMDKKIHGFGSYDAVMTAVESRSSSPVRILRGENLHSSVEGIIPCGEGAGYAGGIMSACVDGINCAEKLL